MPSVLIAAATAAVTATAVLLASPGFAQTTPAEKPDFQQAKQHRLAQIDAMKACVEKATDFAAMKACKPQHK
jgi:hypothetical protein